MSSNIVHVKYINCLPLEENSPPEITPLKTNIEKHETVVATKNAKKSAGVEENRKQVRFAEAAAVKYTQTMYTRTSYHLLQPAFWKRNKGMLCV